MMNVLLRYAFTLFAASLLALAPAGSATLSWRERVLYAFSGGVDGRYPASALISDASGALYGTTTGGGGCAWNPGDGCGTVFKLSPPLGSTGAWSQSVLYAFAGGDPGSAADGYFPRTPLVADASGSLYGTTSQGGRSGAGIVFKLTRSPAGYRETILYQFTGGADGQYPSSGLLLDARGALYGETEHGGLGYGVIYKVSPPVSGTSAWTQTVLHAFGVTPKDGRGPVGGFTAGPDGALYGVTEGGGGYPSSVYSFDGTVFKLAPPSGGASGWTETVLYAFKSYLDGTSPNSPPLFGANGTLFGTTLSGGRNGNGTAYEIFPPKRGRSGCQHCVIAPLGGYSGFASDLTPAAPMSPFVLDGSGTLFIAARGGGPGSHGGVLQLTPPAGGGTTYVETILYEFKGAPDGDAPYAGLLRTGCGFYGTTSAGGAAGFGTVYELCGP